MLCLILFLLFSAEVASFSFFDPSILRTTNGKGGGFGCVGCTVGVYILKNIDEYHETGVVEFLEYLCSLLPGKVGQDCTVFVKDFGPIIQALIQAGLEPDDICRKITLCRGPDLQCRLYPPVGSESESDASQSTPQYLYNDPSEIQHLLQPSHPSTLKHETEPFVSLPQPVPENDLDGDFFSTDFFEYGSAFRGKDCNDYDKTIYPGSRTPGGGGVFGKSCNGINGTDPDTGKLWEEVLCGGTDRRGVAALGDSACAHFRIPQQYFDKNVTLESFRYATWLAMNQADWPHLGMYGGYMEDNTGLTPGAVRSIYTYLLQHNRCNHRDYQTNCANGVASKDAAEDVKYTGRTKDDHPLIQFGDDVCGMHSGFQDMTTPEEFYERTLTTLHELDKILPNGSHVVLVSLVRGALLYPYLSDQLHPCGRPYKDVYSYLICLDTNPCWGWLNTNETVRNMTQKRADELSAQYPRILKEYGGKFSFKMHYINTGEISDEILHEFLEKKINPRVLVEPVDGFHPSQTFLPIFADKLYSILSKDPTVFGRVNPNNDKIKQLFGDQGGY